MSAPAVKRLDAVGEPRATIESARHVRGAGQFVADVQLPRMLHVAFVRSPHAHAFINSVDTSRARRAPGVAAVLTGADVAAAAGPIHTFATSHDPPLPIPVHALVQDKARHAGEPVAAVAATTRALAEDAAALIEVDYDVLPAVLSVGAALADGAPRVHEGIAGNRIMHRRYDFGDVDRLFAEADHVVRRELVWSRHTGTPLDTFGCVAQWDHASDGVTFWSNHHSFGMLASLGPTLGIPGSHVRAIATDLGGSFGGKFWQPRPMVVCALISKRTGRPVKYVEDRVENLEGGDNHGEERVHHAELAVDRDGRMRALRMTYTEDYGSAFVLGPINASEPLSAAVGPYTLEAFGVDFTAVLTNKTAQAAYRGMGSAPLNFVIERMVDAAAFELGLDRVELRRRNLLQPEQLPYKTPIGNLYDSGDYPRALQMALEAADLDGWKARQEQARAEGRAIGIGIATCQDRSVQGGTALWLMFDQNPGRGTTVAETATVRIDAMGNVRVALHSPSLGTSPESVAALVAATELGVPLERVRVTRMDTAISGPALGPSASRLTVMLSGAVAGAARELIERLRPLAAQLLESEQVTWDAAHGAYVDPAGRDAPLAVLAARANTGALSLPAGMRSGLEATFTYDHPKATMPDPDGGDWGYFAPVMGHSVHVPVVEVDVALGEVRFLSYTVVHDCGTVLNPDSVRGQVIGGIAQGIGSTLAEELTYGPSGRLNERDFRSYFVPTFIDMPPIDLHHLESPSPFTWRGAKGVGEGGRVVAPAAVVSAVEDALAPWRVQIGEIPVTPEKIARWVEDA